MADGESLEQHPRVILWTTHPTFQAIFAVVALGIVALFIGLSYVLRPYDGMAVDFHSAGTLRVQQVHPEGPADEAGFRVGDQVLSIDDTPISVLHRAPLYPLGTARGDTVTYKVQRGNRVLTLALTVGSHLDSLPWLAKTVSMQLLAIGIWAVGSVLCLFVPPQDVGPRLVGLAWLIGAVAVATTHPGGWVCLATACVMYASAAFLGAAFVAAHLYFPAPSFSARWRKCIVNSAASAAGALFAAHALTPLALLLFERWATHDAYAGELLTTLGIGLYGTQQAFTLLTVLIGTGLLVRNRFRARDADVRRQVGIILSATALCAVPFAVLTAFQFATPAVYPLYPYTILFGLGVPPAYAYVIYQRKLLRVEFIINRAVVLFVLVLLVFTGSAGALAGLDLAFHLPLQTAVLGGVLATAVALISPSLHRAIQRRVDRTLYGQHYDFSSVTSSFSSRFAQAVDRQTLTSLLTQDLTQQMGIQQALLLLAEDGVLRPQPPEADAPALATDDELCKTLLQAARPTRAQQMWGLVCADTRDRWQSCAWGQLFVPLVYQGQLAGLLILGHRPTGDLYTRQDVQIAAAVAHQAALAYRNVQLVESLRGLNQQLVRSDEEQRKRVARDLHDTALQHLFFIKRGLLRDYVPGELVNLLEKTIESLRQTISELRPPLLDHGLPLALQELVEEMQKLAGLTPAIRCHANVVGQLHLHDEQATALYRIAQEALANALKHAQAREITVTLNGPRDGAIRLCVSDDGVGTTARAPAERERHYGVASMQERAAMIGAHLDIASAPGQGTSITVEIPA